MVSKKTGTTDNVLKLVKSHNKRIIIDVKTKRERALRSILNMVKNRLIQIC